MKCPHCNKELDLVAPADLNCEAYGGVPRSVTRCCGNIVQFKRTIIVTPYIPYNHDELIVDDWNNKKII